MSEYRYVRVWDPLVRIFHWGIVALFTVAFITEDDSLTLHVWAGYGILVLLVVRFAWGYVGPRHARFSDFVRSPRQVWGYLRDSLIGPSQRYVGHNPAGGAMAVVLMVLLLATGLTGLAVYGAEESAGPLSGLMAGSGHWLGEAAEEVHEFLANLTLVCVFVHVAGVAFSSLQHRENLVRGMITGLKRRAEQH